LTASRQDDPRAAPPVGFRLAAAGCGAVAALAIGLAAATLAGVDVRGSWRSAGRALGPTPTVAPTGMIVGDPRLGHRHVPGARIRAEGDGFSVTYRIDALGARRIPAHDGAPEGRPVVEVLGDSFTFGHGVEDGEAYPAVLQADHWPGVEVRNRGVNGYGPFHALGWLEEAAADSPPPARVLYGWLSFHLQRVSPDPAWLAMVARSDQRMPYYRLEGGRLAFQGLIGLEDALEADDPELPAIAWANLEAALSAMDRVAAGWGTRFAVVVLPHRHEAMAAPDVARLRAFLSRAGIAAVDVADMPGATDDALYLEGDGHPTAAWHRRVAAAIAGVLPEP